jgi:hypothetical protein
MATIAEVISFGFKVSCRVQTIGATSSSAGWVRKVAGPVHATANIKLASKDDESHPGIVNGGTKTLTVTWKTSGPTFVLPAIAKGPTVDANINSGTAVAYNYDFVAWDTTTDFTNTSIFAGTISTGPMTAGMTGFLVDWT